MNKEEKIQQVEELAQEAAESGAVIFSDYSGLTVGEMTELRKNLSGMGADLRVVKNTILRRALEKAGLFLAGELSGPTAALFSRSADPIESIKALVVFLRAKSKGEVKAGFFEKAEVSVSEILSLAALPGRKILQSQLIFQIKSPMYRLVYALSSSQKRLVWALGQVLKAKGGVNNG